MALNFGLLDTSIPERLGAMPANALAMRRQRIMQDEDRAFQREGQQMQNALARMQMQKAQGEMEQEQAYRNALSRAPAGDWNAVLPEIRKVAPDRAMALEKQLGEMQKGKAETRAKMSDVAHKKLGMYREALVNVNSPQQFAQWLTAQHSDPDLQELMGALPSLEDSLATIPQDPREFEQMKVKSAVGIGKFMEMNKPSDFERTMDAAGLSPEQRQAAARQRLMKETTHAPGTSVSVNTGQKGFENELKVRGDFRSEPVYKAHQEMSSAYSQIQQALKQASPAGDLAGATKIMKLLDPGSVVRESELGMAMAASGLLDRVSNYATNIINGTKLTPTQRADFQRLADALYSESVKAYNAKGNEYRSIATDYGMNPERIIGAPVSAPATGKVGKSQYVETRRTADGRTLGKRADGTVEVIQ